MTRTAPAPRPRRAWLSLERLDERAVPATLVDLGSASATGSANGALLLQGDNPSAGTQPTYSFLRLQSYFGEQGYNTTARPVQFDEDPDADDTRALTLGQVPVVTVNGVNYREFLLRTNQFRIFNWSLVSLDELRVYVGPAGNLTGYDAATKQLAGRAPAYDLDGAGDVTVKLEDRLAASGAWDARVLVPDAAFTGAGVSDFVYLYSKFGGTWWANDGAEEWGVRPGAPTPGPSPAPVLGSLSGYVYFDADNDGVREPDGNEFSVQEYGLEGVSLHLTGVNDLGQAVDLWAVTDASGFYQFANLRPGTYTITRPEFSVPVGFFDGKNTPGNQGGVSNESNSEPQTYGADMFSGIALLPGASGTGYNFGMLEVPVGG